MKKTHCKKYYKMNYADKRLNIFEQKYHNLEEYYGISNKIKLKHNRIGNKIKLNIYFKKSNRYEFIELPREINNIISEYTPVFISINLEITFPIDYPMNNPIFSFVNIQNNLSNPPINLEEYYKYIITNHNEQYKKYWSPAISIPVHILDFIQKINHFEYLI